MLPLPHAGADVLSQAKHDHHRLFIHEQWLLACGHMNRVITLKHAHVGGVERVIQGEFLGLSDRGHGLIKDHSGIVHTCTTGDIHL